MAAQAPSGRGWRSASPARGGMRNSPSASPLLGIANAVSTPNKPRNSEEFWRWQPVVACMRDIEPHDLKLLESFRAAVLGSEVQDGGSQADGNELLDALNSFAPLGEHYSVRWAAEDRARREALAAEQQRDAAAAGLPSPLLQLAGGSSVPSTPLHSASPVLRTSIATLPPTRSLQEELRSGLSCTVDVSQSQAPLLLERQLQKSSPEILRTHPQEARQAFQIQKRTITKSPKAGVSTSPASSALMASAQTLGDARVNPGESGISDGVNYSAGELKHNHRKGIACTACTVRSASRRKMRPSRGSASPQIGTPPPSSTAGHEVGVVSPSLGIQSTPAEQERDGTSLQIQSLEAGSADAPAKKVVSSAQEPMSPPLLVQKPTNVASGPAVAPGSPLLTLQAIPASKAIAAFAPSDREASVQPRFSQAKVKHDHRRGVLCPACTKAAANKNRSKSLSAAGRAQQQPHGRKSTGTRPVQSGEQGKQKQAALGAEAEGYVDSRGARTIGVEASPLLAHSSSRRQASFEIVRGSPLLGSPRVRAGTSNLARPSASPTQRIQRSPGGFGSAFGNAPFSSSSVADRAAIRRLIEERISLIRGWQRCTLCVHFASAPDLKLLFFYRLPLVLESIPICENADDQPRLRMPPRENGALDSQVLEKECASSETKADSTRAIKSEPFGAAATVAPLPLPTAAATTTQTARVATSEAAGGAAAGIGAFVRADAISDKDETHTPVAEVNETGHPARGKVETGYSNVEAGTTFSCQKDSTQTQKQAYRVLRVLDDCVVEEDGYEIHVTTAPAPGRSGSTPQEARPRSEKPCYACRDGNSRPGDAGARPLPLIFGDPLAYELYMVQKALAELAARHDEMRSKVLERARKEIARQDARNARLEEEQDILTKLRALKKGKAKEKRPSGFSRRSGGGGTQAQAVGNMSLPSRAQTYPTDGDLRSTGSGNGPQAEAHLNGLVLSVPLRADSLDDSASLGAEPDAAADDKMLSLAVVQNLKTFISEFEAYKDVHDELNMLKTLVEELNYREGLKQGNRDVSFALYRRILSYLSARQDVTAGQLRQLYSLLVPSARAPKTEDDSALQKPSTPQSISGTKRGRRSSRGSNATARAQAEEKASAAPSPKRARMPRSFQ
ncbi:hypothetical protein FVE85_8126 [Porphyridium purpureum]|uniref:Uncharacterized protein n=1 Tax=Porphyridium purpureum TaxID=35688 RepID=A0A5J4YMF7_PORPP|nr:hypothetical protein FVE85_8126 [Porphyridium purpureum]|eukprot:POR6663..scf295_9